MIRLGLSSQAFPARSPREVIALALDLGLEGVEWAAESHLAPGNSSEAQALLFETLMARLAIVSFAALYRVDPEKESGLGFQALLDTASSLQAPILRIFAGRTAYASAEYAEKFALREELGRLGDLAAKRGITLCLSLSKGTALEDYASATALITELAHPFVRLAWESLPGKAPELGTQAIQGLKAETSLILARSADRRGRAAALDTDCEAWEARLSAFLEGETEPKMSRFVLLGRMGNGDEERLREDAAFLGGLAKAKNPPFRC